jgi:hypothetical protein
MLNLLQQQTYDPAAIGNAILALASGQTGGSTAKKAVSGTPTAQLMHGPGGLFSTPGVRAPVFSAFGLPVSGVLAQLPAYPNDEMYPLFATLTGQTDNTGSQPTGDCPDYPVVGDLKVCRTWLPFGRRGVSTKVIDVTKLGRRNDRSEMMDFKLMNNALTASGLFPEVPGMLTGGGDILNNEVMGQMYKMANGLVFATEKDIWTANYDTSPIDFYGFQKQINTGYRDAIQQGVTCPVIDSNVRPFANKSIQDFGASFVRELVYMRRYARHLAAHVGIRVELKFAMRESAFYEATEVWPCNYYTNRCAPTATGNTNFTDSRYLQEMRDSMRGDLDNYTGQYLWMDGQMVPVIIDDTIPETQLAGGKFVSDVFMIPITANGIPTTFIEYFDYDGPNGPVEMAKAMSANGQSPVMSVEGGRFLLIYKTPTNTCFQYQLQTEIRLIERTPWLAGRLTNVGYVPLYHTREFDPSAPSNYLNGGISTNAGYGPSYYSPTS